MKKKSYWSSLFNIITFAIMMLFLLAIVVCFIILIADATIQARSGQPEYVPDRDFLTFFAVLCIVAAPYTLFYLCTLIVFFNKRKRVESGSNIKIQLNNSQEIKDGDAKMLNKKYDAEVVDDSLPVQGNLKYTYVSESRDYDKKIVRRFAYYLAQEQIIVFVLLDLLVFAFAALMYFINPILFWILLVLGVASVAFNVYLFFFATPNKIYKRTVENKLPNSLRVYEDRLEEVNVLGTGEEIKYVFNYQFTKYKNDGNYLFLKTKNDKLTIGLLIDKNKVGEEIINYVLSSIGKNK